MALRPCRECGKQVSTDAKACPACGVASPTVAPAGWRTKVVLAAGSLLFFGWCFNRVASVPGAAVVSANAIDTEEGRATAVVTMAKQHLKGRLQDPTRARFGEVAVNRIRLGGEQALVGCGTMRLKNRLGGYGDPLRWVSTGTDEHTYVDGSDGFESAWTGLCVGTDLVATVAADAP